MKLEWQKNNPEKKAAIARRYYDKNKEKIKEYTKYYKREMRTPKQRLRENVSRRIWRALKGDVKKSKKTMELIGCSIDELKEHLESGFTDGMSWDNYGDWHVDHIVPCKSFDLSNPREQKKCFHYKNLQPLWAFDNRSKKDNNGLYL